MHAHRIWVRAALVVMGVVFVGWMIAMLAAHKLSPSADTLRSELDVHVPASSAKGLLVISGMLDPRLQTVVHDLEKDWFVHHSRFAIGSPELRDEIKAYILERDLHVVVVLIEAHQHDRTQSTPSASRLRHLREDTDLGALLSSGRRRVQILEFDPCTHTLQRRTE